MVDQQFLAAALVWLVKRASQSLGTPVSDRVFQAAAKSRVCPHRKVQRSGSVCWASKETSDATEAGDMSRSLLLPYPVSLTTTVQHLWPLVRCQPCTTRPPWRVGVAATSTPTLCSPVYQWGRFC